MKEKDKKKREETTVREARLKPPRVAMLAVNFLALGASAYLLPSLGRHGEERHAAPQIARAVRAGWASTDSAGAVRPAPRSAAGPALAAVVAALLVAGRAAAPAAAPRRRQLRAPAPRLGSPFAPPTGPVDDKVARENALVRWLEDNGMYLSNKSGWGRAAHPIRIEAETVEDFELSGRGLLARKSLQQGEEIARVPQALIMTRKAAQRVLGRQIIPDDLGEYHHFTKSATLFLAIILQNVWNVFCNIFSNFFCA